jgi:hypothetical protein
MPCNERHYIRECPSESSLVFVTHLQPKIIPSHRTPEFERAGTCEPSVWRHLGERYVFDLKMNGLVVSIPYCRESCGCLHDSAI